MAEQTEKTTGEVVQLVNFRLGNEEFGVDIGSVKEIVRVGDITHIPEVPSFIQGVINLRGKIIAVIDLARQFDLPPRQELAPSARIVVTEIKGHIVGMLVDAVPEVSKMPVENIESTPAVIQSGIEKDYIRGVGKLGDRLIIILDLEKVLAASEVAEVVRVGKSAKKA